MLTRVILKPGGDKTRDILQGGSRTSVKDNLRVLKGMLEYAGQIERNAGSLLLFSVEFI
jgi:hypothetical protein